MRILTTLSAVLLAGALAGCADPKQDLYYETHEIKNLTVILLDDKALQRRWQYVSGQPASRTIKFTVAGSQISMADTVKGFFDYKTNTISAPRTISTSAGTNCSMPSWAASTRNGDRSRAQGCEA